MEGQTGMLCPWTVPKRPVLMVSSSVHRNEIIHGKDAARLAMTVQPG